MGEKGDPFDLERFLEAQAGIHAQAQLEIEEGNKRGHWMWFIFPQIAGLGRSSMSARFAIRSLAEAKAYLAHPVLGPRLRSAVGALQKVKDPSAVAVFGPIDAMKLHSSLTLFEAAERSPIFEDALNRWFDGKADERTLELIAIGSVS